MLIGKLLNLGMGREFMVRHRGLDGPHGGSPFGSAICLSLWC